jgi:hypothetical protein
MWRTTMAKKMGAAEMLTGKKGRAARISTLIPEDEFRYLYSVLTEHDPVSKVGQEMLDRLLKSMGEKIDEWNTYDPAK